MRVPPIRRRGNGIGGARPPPEASPEHPLAAPEAPRQPGVYVLLRGSVPVYVGKAKDLRSRLNDCLRKAAIRKGINVQKVTYRFVTIERRWEILRAKAALRRRYKLG